MSNGTVGLVLNVKIKETNTGDSTMKNVIEELKVLTVPYKEMDNDFARGYLMGLKTAIESIQSAQKCKKCGGSGRLHSEDYDYNKSWVDCNNCNGSGKTF